MTPLFTAIYGKLVGSLLAGQIGTRMYLNEASQKAAFPYVVFQLLPGVTDYVMCPEAGFMNFDECSVQFNLFSKIIREPAEVGTMFTNLMALYDWCNLAIGAPYSDHYMRRDGQHLMRDIDEKVWQYVVNYTILLES
ncbi:hypothetical protein KAR91_26330 [Candidatus Pacearchaeota archaeon]|nr:hypothetical protein [Candidatus Pacearchaeota archaeon]